MSDITETTTVQDGQAAVRTVTVSGQLKPAASATDVITLVKTADGDQAAVKVVSLGGGGGGGPTTADKVSMVPLSSIDATNVQDGLAEVNEVIERTENYSSLLEYSDVLDTSIRFTKTSAQRDEVLSGFIDSRPGYFGVGAFVIDQEGNLGIIDSVSDNGDSCEIAFLLGAGGVDALVIEEY